MKVVTGNVCAAENVGNGKNCSLSELKSDDPALLNTQKDGIKLCVI